MEKYYFLFSPNIFSGISFNFKALEVAKQMFHSCFFSYMPFKAFQTPPACPTWDSFVILRLRELRWPRWSLTTFYWSLDWSGGGLGGRRGVTGLCELNGGVNVAGYPISDIDHDAPESLSSHKGECKNFNS